MQVLPSGIFEDAAPEHPITGAPGQLRQDANRGGPDRKTENSIPILRLQNKIGKDALPAARPGAASSGYQLFGVGEFNGWIPLFSAIWKSW